MVVTCRPMVRVSTNDSAASQPSPEAGPASGDPVLDE
jgi:hypothetical protein